ncbi:hypothetical protein KGV55_03030 [Candidatus Gracilibacteria bacterium]|nr:hypothetical protein [Candidatus Gracilibacteria bacterium]
MRLFTFFIFFVYILCSCSTEKPENTPIQHSGEFSNIQKNQKKIIIETDPNAFASENTQAK